MVYTHFVGEIPSGLGKGTLHIYKVSDVSLGHLELGQRVRIRGLLGSEEEVIVRFRGSRELCESWEDAATGTTRPTRTVLVVPESERSRRSKRLHPQPESDEATVPEEEHQMRQRGHSVSFALNRKPKLEPLDDENEEGNEMMDDDDWSPIRKRSSSFKRSPAISSTSSKFNRKKVKEEIPKLSPRFTVIKGTRKQRTSNVAKARHVSIPSSSPSSPSFSHLSHSHSSSSSHLNCSGCRKERRKRLKMEKRFSNIESSLENIERCVEYLALNTTARPVQRYRGIEYFDREEVADLSRSTPNDGAFLRYLLDGLFYRDNQNMLPSTERDKEKMRYVKDLFFTLRANSEDEARKKWNQLIRSFDDNLVRRRQKSLTWKEARPKVKQVYIKKKRVIIDTSDEESEDNRENDSSDQEM